MIPTIFGETFIIGGYVPQPHTEPHILSLQRGTTNMHFCGATLVSSTHGVSAAHCYYNPAIVTGFKFCVRKLNGKSEQNSVIDH